MDTLNTVCTVLFICLILLGLVQVIWKIYKERCSYFKCFWNCLDGLLILDTMAAVALMAMKSEYTRQMVLKVQRNPYARMSFDYVVLFTDLESGTFAVISFLMTIKLLRLLKFNANIMTFTQCIRCSSDFLVSFSLIFSIVLMAYAQVGVLIFGQIEGSYSSLLRAIITELSIILGGKMGYQNLDSIGHVLGPLFLFSFSLVNTIILMNFFMTILNDSLTEAKGIPPANNVDAQLSDFMEEQLIIYLKDIAKELRKITEDSNKKKNIQEVHKYREADFFLY